MLNQFDPQNRGLLDGIQGNILKAHGRHHTANIFIECQEGKQAEAKAWLKSLVDPEEGVIQSAYAQLRSAMLWKENKVDTGLFACMHISAAGYDYLFDKDARLDSFEQSFRDGMKKARQRLDDPKSETWDIGLQANNHFMLLLAHANTDALAKAVDHIYEQTQFFAAIRTIEWGNALLNDEGAGIEHFGYVDGVSQPLFFEDEWQTYKTNNGILNEATDIKFDPRADQSLVLINDPFGDTNAQGSYFVFRKLEQNVKGFKQAELKMADTLGLIDEDRERVGAMLVGRFEDGTPVQVSGEEGIIHNSVFNNFDYKTPTDNSRCPFHAHIRKTNPRFDPVRENEQVKSNHVMARRGIPYGIRTDGPNDGNIYNKPEGRVGLLFMSYQRSIETQFEFIQKAWVNNPEFPSFGSTKPDGIDPIIGQGPGSRTGEFATTWADPTTLKQASFEQFIHLKGGEYFFTPSMSFLKNILLSSLLMLVCMTAQAQKVTPLSTANPIAGGVTYFLPQVGLVVNVPITTTTYTLGEDHGCGFDYFYFSDEVKNDLREYSTKYGPDYKKEGTPSYHSFAMGNVTVTPKSIRDSTKGYRMDIAKRGKKALFQYDENGFLISGTVENNNDPLPLILKGVEVGVSLLKLWGSAAYSSSLRANDTCKTIKKIEKLRAVKETLLMKTDVAGGGLTQQLEAIDRQIQFYVDRIVKVTQKTETVSFFVLPEPSWLSCNCDKDLFGYDSEKNVLTINRNLSPLILTEKYNENNVQTGSVENAYKLSVQQVKAESITSHFSGRIDSTYKGLAYNIPEKCMVSVRKGPAFSANQQIAFPQFGKVGFMPHKLKKLDFTLDPLTGALRSITGEGKAALTADNISQAGGILEKFKKTPTPTKKEILTEEVALLELEVKKKKAKAELEQND